MASLPSSNRNWEDVFCTWGGAPSASAQTKYENAERAIVKAVNASQKLSAKDIEVFVQGSYANRTNVRQDSDVDVCVLYKGAFFPDYSMSQGLTGALLGFPDGHYLYTEFKNDVEAALKSCFGAASVTRGKKAFDVHANTYRIDADGVYRNEPRYQDRTHSQIHFGALWLRVIDTPTQMLEGHYWTDRNTAGEMQLTEKRREKFQDFESARAFYAQLPPTGKH